MPSPTRSVHGITQEALDRVERHGRDLMNEADRRYEQRFQDSKEAITKAETSAERRFEAVNEFRAQLGDQQRTYIPRIEAEARLANLEKQIESLELNSIALRAQNKGGREVWAYLVAAIGLIFGAISLFAK